MLQWLEITKPEVKEEFDKGKEISLYDDSVKIAEKDLNSDDCEIETSNIYIYTECRINNACKFVDESSNYLL